MPANLLYERNYVLPNYIVFIDIHINIRSSSRFINVFIVIADSSSTNTTENPSPSLSPPQSASKTSPIHSSYMNNSNDSDDDGQEIIEDDGPDSPDRPSDSGSPSLSGSMQSKRKKKTRTVFSRAQVFQLESTFDCKR